jgi:Cu2+-containing amine oxidase
MDSGEYGFGINMTPLKPGVDCPMSATFLDSTLHDDFGMPLLLGGTMCVFERRTGDPAWRHFEGFAQTPEAAIPAEGRPATELVFRYASTVGNYDYLVDYIFMQDGTIKVAVGSTGYVDGNCVFLLLFIANDCAFINAHIPPTIAWIPRRGRHQSPCPMMVRSKRPSTAL